ncbi:MAG: transglutaminase-like putative cysteine protease [Pirellulaceae bacterium]
MQYEITHITNYEYGANAALCQNRAHLVLRDVFGQACKSCELQVTPTPSETSRSCDFFGNPVDYFAIFKKHRRLSITAVSVVDVNKPVVPKASLTPSWKSVRDELEIRRDTAWIDASQYVHGSPHVPPLDELHDYAIPSFAAERPVLAGAAELCQRIFNDFTFDPVATDVQTPLETVFKKKRGVCQDLAHVQIGCLRSLGIPARYVSGYLRTAPPPGQQRLVGADASHAWLSVFCGDFGWVDLDPTNNMLPRNDHITVAWGRDYFDVRPVNGIFIGGGQHQLNVSVDVAPVEEHSVG